MNHLTWHERRGGSTSRRTAGLMEAADRSLEIRKERLAFRRLEAALGWYWLYRERLQSPKSPQIREDRDIEGGQGGDIDEALATVHTIGEALRGLELEQPRQYAFVLEAHRDGRSLREMAAKAGLSHQTVSTELGRGESYLTGWLRRAAVLS